MKICFVGQKGMPAKAGGVERHVEELATRLVKAGHEVSAYSRWNYSDRNIKEYKGVKLINLPSINSKNLDAISHTFLACLDIIFRRNFDIVVFEAIGPSSLIWMVRLFRPNLPVIGAFRSKCYRHKKWGLFARAYLRFGEYACNRFPDAVVASSRNLIQYAREEYGINAEYITNGVETKATKNFKEINKLWNLKKNGYILAVSRLIRHKNVHQLIEVYNQLKTDKKLVIVGDGSFTDDYVWELKTAAMDNPNIIFTGNQFGDTLHELYSNAYLFVQPSEAEGLSNSLLEAMSYGIPVLASDIVENREPIGNTGYYFRTNDLKDFRKQLRIVLNSPVQAAKKARLAQKKVDIEYGWANITLQAINIFQSVIDKKKARSIVLVPNFARRLISLIF